MIDAGSGPVEDLQTAALAMGFLFGIAIAVGISLLYYFLSRTLTLGFVEHSGVISAIKFKRSVIENVDVNEGQARYICEITQFLIEASRKPILGAP